MKRHYQLWALFTIVVLCAAFIIAKGYYKKQTSDKDCGFRGSQSKKISSRGTSITRKRHRSRGFMRGKGSISSRKKEQKFENLQTTAERVNNLNMRLANIRKDVENSKNPEKIVSAIMHDISTLRGFEKLVYETALERKLASLSPDDQNKFEWIASIYPRIENMLRTNIKSTLMGTQTSSEIFFGALHTNSDLMGIDVYEELLKINDPVARNKIIAGILPSMITADSDLHTELLNKLPEKSQREVEQAVIKLSARDRIYQTDALGIYLGGGGEQGNHEEQISRFFNNTVWFWKNSDQLGEMIDAAERGERRDVVLENMIRIMARRDLETAKKWLDEIDDPVRKQRITTKIFKE